MPHPYSHIFDGPKHSLNREGDYCDHENCPNLGAFKAPKNREGDFYWFCLDHVRAYNAAWNYYQDIPDTELEGYIRQDTTWQRPSWPLHMQTAYTKINNVLDDFLSSPFQGHTSREKSSERHPQISKEIHHALVTLELSYPYTKQELKKHFRSMAKKHHPDANHNNAASVEKIKKINEAYMLLKKHTPSTF